MASPEVAATAMTQVMVEGRASQAEAAAALEPVAVRLGARAKAKVMEEVVVPAMGVRASSLAVESLQEAPGMR